MFIDMIKFHITPFEMFLPRFLYISIIAITYSLMTFQLTQWGTGNTFRF